MLTRPQILENLHAMAQQGAKLNDIQGYLKSVGANEKEYISGGEPEVDTAKHEDLQQKFRDAQQAQLEAKHKVAIEEQKNKADYIKPDAEMQYRKEHPFKAGAEGMVGTLATAASLIPAVGILGGSAIMGAGEGIKSLIRGESIPSALGTGLASAAMGAGIGKVAQVGLPFAGKVVTGALDKMGAKSAASALGKTIGGTETQAAGWAERKAKNIYESHPNTQKANDLAATTAEINALKKEEQARAGAYTLQGKERDVLEAGQKIAGTAQKTEQANVVSTAKEAVDKARTEANNALAKAEHEHGLRLKEAQAKSKSAFDGLSEMNMSGQIVLRDSLPGAKNVLAAEKGAIKDVAKDIPVSDLSPKIIESLDSIQAMLPKPQPAGTAGQTMDTLTNILQHDDMYKYRPEGSKEGVGDLTTYLSDLISSPKSTAADVVEAVKTLKRFQGKLYNSGLGDASKKLEGHVQNIVSELDNTLSKASDLEHLGPTPMQSLNAKWTKYYQVKPLVPEMGTAIPESLGKAFVKVSKKNDPQAALELYKQTDNHVRAAFDTLNLLKDTDPVLADKLNTMIETTRKHYLNASTLDDAVKILEEAKPTNKIGGIKMLSPEEQKAMDTLRQLQKSIKTQSQLAAITKAGVDDTMARGSLAREVEKQAAQAKIDALYDSLPAKMQDELKGITDMASIVLASFPGHYYTRMAVNKAAKLAFTGALLPGGAKVVYKGLEKLRDMIPTSELGKPVGLMGSQFIQHLMDTSQEGQNATTQGQEQHR